ncbi:P-loop containing nucleoside triphosphate hydrolase protein [Viridothelium virens]|uniref:RNA helicase n=1 Tax=Viridothelium virens TaxID=1048519 RepID=A0A6A6HHR9_VIRVR|nr:P-loop containing nucleoside triphosphate hydrolase protein [Viridothelium virens]
MASEPFRGQKRKREHHHHHSKGGTNPHVNVIQKLDGKITTQGGPQSKSTLQESHSKGGRINQREKAKSLQAVREQLPIWRSRKDIREALDQNDVLILSGETGSGKSTQVPQFLLESQWCKGQIAITQPRRVAAISLARRVAAEMGTTLGSSSPASRVGYSVRFDNSTSPAMRVKYLTEGMLLQELLRDPWLKNYSIVVVDEVHERSINVDLILGFLRRIVTGEAQGEGKREKRLKVVIMSATVDVESFVEFFQTGFRKIEEQQKQEAADEEEDNYSESSWSGISTSEDEKAPLQKDNSIPVNGNVTKALLRFKNKPRDKSDYITINGKVINLVPDRSKSQQKEPCLGQPNGQNEEYRTLDTKHVATCFIKGRQYPVQVFYMPEPTNDFLESSLTAVFQIHYGEPLPGDILVFLTGQDTVEALQKSVEDHATGMAPEMPKILVLPLFAALSPAQQAQVFLPAHGYTRKVILATNIAETSLTIPGIRYVIDTGKAKAKHFHNGLGLESLLVKTISQSSAIQRKGRAGREMPGKCWRLYTEQGYQEMEKTGQPEILRCDLSSALLVMKARGVDDVINFPLMNPPRRDGIENGLLHLLTLGALTERGVISSIGIQMSRLPLLPSLARVIVEGARNDGEYLLEIIDIVAALTVENLFLNPATEEKREEADTARAELTRRQGDLLTFLATVRSYAAENANRKAWTEKRYISHRGMQNVMNVRKQLRSLCQQQKLLPPSSSLKFHDYDEGPLNVSEDISTSILKCFLKGFHANTARLMPDGSYKTFVGNHAVAIHPSSVLFGKKVEALMFVQFVFTNKSYARGVSAVQLNWIGDALDGGEIA